MAEPKSFIVTKVNPAPKKKKASKTVAKKKAAKKKPAKKKAAKKKAAKKKPAKKKASKPNPRKKASKKVAKKKAKKKPYKRKRAPVKKKKKAGTRSRKNPALSIDPQRPFQNFFAHTLGQVIVAASVRKWGDKVVVGAFSPTTGAPWSIKNYIIGSIAAFVGGEAIARFGDRKGFGQEVYDAGMQLVMTKAIWTELIGRVPMLQTYLGHGHDNSAIAQLKAQANEGDIIDEGGNRWLLQNGQWISMQGTDDPYTPQQLAGDPYTPKELGGTLTKADYLGGVLVQADYLDGMGHTMPKGSPRALVNRAQWQDTGSDNPYHTMYQQ